MGGSEESEAEPGEEVIGGRGVCDCGSAQLQLVLAWLAVMQGGDQAIAGATNDYFKMSSDLKRGGQIENFPATGKGGKDVGCG